MSGVGNTQVRPRATPIQLVSVRTCSEKKPFRPRAGVSNAALGAHRAALHRHTPNGAKHDREPPEARPGRRLVY